MTQPRAEACMLVLIDLQVDSLAATSTRPGAEVSKTAAALVELAKLHGMPVIATAGRKPGAGAALIPELARLSDLSARTFAHTTIDAFDDAGFAAAIAGARRRMLILCGVALDIGVTATALSARALGYDVFIVAEACATTDPLAEATALSRLSAGGVTWIGFAALTLALMGDFDAPTARETLALLHAIAPAHARAHQ